MDSCQPITASASTSHRRSRRRSGSWMRRCASLAPNKEIPLAPAPSPIPHRRRSARPEPHLQADSGARHGASAPPYPGLRRKPILGGGIYAGPIGFAPILPVAHCSIAHPGSPDPRMSLSAPILTVELLRHPRLGEPAGAGLLLAARYPLTALGETES
jgi:hypothetical protein